MQRARGFSLLEILVAFTLLAVALAVLMQVFSRGVTNADLADRYAKANMLAESMLESIGSEIALAEGESSGDFENGYSWRTTIKLYSTTAEEPAAMVSTTSTAGMVPPNSTTPTLGQPASVVSANATANAAAAAAVAAANSNVDPETLLPVRVYEIDLAVVFKSDDGRERVVGLNTLKLGPKPT